MRDHAKRVLKVASATLNAVNV
ncbi:hypothetical protein AGR4A_pAt30034 [Agrobacterium tumefaciens str. B6]|uniref:Uncharacterized protein n=1 Tax=Agrobacterium tumefaciens str. B6 TaxID=1183423 RepID=A0A822VC80_AGRTU|nr:hypothetical protein AGR4A_pAt30034 [Agrobacterium tumefaciens str. B6]